MTGRLETESKLLSAARDALSLDPVDRDVIGPVQGEIKDLREVSCPSPFDSTSSIMPLHAMLFVL